LLKGETPGPTPKAQPQKGKCKMQGRGKVGCKRGNTRENDRECDSTKNTARSKKGREEGGYGITKVVHQLLHTSFVQNVTIVNKHTERKQEIRSRGPSHGGKGIRRTKVKTFG